MPETKNLKKPKGLVTINAELCKGCGFCIEFCPSGVLEFSAEFNLKGYHPPRVVRLSMYWLRPVRYLLPDFAIFGLLIKSVA